MNETPKPEQPLDTIPLNDKGFPLNPKDGDFWTKNGVEYQYVGDGAGLMHWESEDMTKKRAELEAEGAGAHPGDMSNYSEDKPFQKGDV